MFDWWYYIEPRHFWLGLAIVLLADIPVRLFRWVALKASDLPDNNPISSRILMGVFERLMTFFLVVSKVDPTAIATVLVAWTGAKLASNWQRAPVTGKRGDYVRGRTLVALMAGTLSLAFGILGGLVALC